VQNDFWVFTACDMSFSNSKVAGYVRVHVGISECEPLNNIKNWKFSSTWHWMVENGQPSFPAASQPEQCQVVKLPGFTHLHAVKVQG
jgi:hypothetical protein